MGKYSKRHKPYYVNLNKSKKIPGQKSLGPNMAGFLCTCIKNEDACAREAMSLLEEFANKLYGPENTTTSSSGQSGERSSDVIEDDDSDDDIEKDLKAEIEALRKPREMKVASADDESPPKSSRFERLHVHVHSCVFIATTLENPVNLSVAIMDYLKETKVPRTKVLCRMIPVLKTCRAYIEDIEQYAKDMLLEYLPRRPISFCIVFTFRNNSSINKQALLTQLSEFATKVNPQMTVTFKTPDIVLSVDVVQKFCCLSLLPQYLTSYHKYNLFKVANKPYVHFMEQIKMKNEEEKKDSHIDPAAVGSSQPENTDKSDNTVITESVVT